MAENYIRLYFATKQAMVLWLKKSFLKPSSSSSIFYFIHNPDKHITLPCEKCDTDLFIIMYFELWHYMNFWGQYLGMKYA
jgi:hypothetical protein